MVEGNFYLLPDEDMYCFITAMNGDTVVSSLVLEANGPSWLCHMNEAVFFQSTELDDIWSIEYMEADEYGDGYYYQCYVRSYAFSWIPYG